MNRFVPGLVVGAILGLALGWLLWGLGGDKTPAPSEPASLAGKLPVRLGSTRDKAGATLATLSVENRTGEALGPVRATCRFFDVHGREIGQGSKDWPAAAPGATLEGEIAMPGMASERIDHFQCRADRRDG